MHRYWIVGLVAFVLVACGATPTPTVDVAPTLTRAVERSQLATASAPTATPLPTTTPVPPTVTPLPTNTAIPPTATPVPPTATRTPVPPTATAAASFFNGPPTATQTPICSSADGQRLTATLTLKAQEWDDANALARSTPRVALAPQIQNLQRIRREATALTVPSCGSKSLALMIAYMDSTIDGFIDFLGQGTKYTALFAQASTQFNAFIAELTHVTVGP